jgi:photosystem II stability/assembly factor-like uncharacterized protein
VPKLFQVIAIALIACPAGAQERLYRARGDNLSEGLVVASSLIVDQDPPAAAGSAEPVSIGKPSGGFTWTEKFRGSNWVFKDLSFGDVDHGFAVAELGRVLRTQDGGESWDTVLNQGFPYYWYGVHTFDASRAVISGFNNQTNDGLLRWTADGGDTWSDDIILPAFGPIHWLDRIAFVDDLNGIVFNYFSAVSYRTESGGETADEWDGVQPPQEGWFGGNFTYQPDGNVWVSGINFCHSQDHGGTWGCRHSIDPIFDGGGVSFPDGMNGWVAGGSISPEVRGWIHRTTDGGKTWSGRILETPFPIRAIEFLDANTGFAVGGNLYSGVGGIYSTIDGGETWNLDLDIGTEIRTVRVVPVTADTVDIWCAGYRQDFGGSIYKARVTR